MCCRRFELVLLLMLLLLLLSFWVAVVEELLLRRLQVSCHGGYFLDRIFFNAGGGKLFASFCHTLNSISNFSFYSLPLFSCVLTSL